MKSKIRVLVWLGSGEDPLFGLEIAIFSLYSHMAERGLGALLGLLCKGTDPIRQDSLPRSDRLPKTPPPNTTTVGVRMGTYKLWGSTDTQSVADTFDLL